MALINVYTGIGSEHDAFYAQDTVRGSLSGYDFREYVLLRSGERITPDTPLSDDDIVFMRRIPEGVTTAAIVMGVVGVLGAIGAGVYSYIQTKRQQKFAQELEESQKAASASSSSKLPFIRGAANQGATSQSLPYVIGHTLFTPYRLCPAFISIDGKYGEHQNYKMVLECGTSPLIIRKMNLGKATVFTDDTDTPQNAVIGLSNGAFTSSASIMEIRNTGDFTTSELNLKTSCTMYSDEIPHRHASQDDDADTIAEIEKEWRAGIVKQCPDNTMAVEVYILFNGCRKFVDDSWQQQTVTLIPQWTDADNPADPYDAQNPGVWHDFDTAFQQPSGTNVRKQAVTAYFSVSANFSSYQGNDEATARSIIRSRWSSKIQRTPGIYIDPEAHKQYKFYIDPSVSWDNAKVTDVRFETRTVEHRTKGTTTYYWDIVFCFQFDGDVLTTGPSNTFTYNYGKEMRFVARQEFTAAQAYGKHISVRLVRTTPKADGTAQDTVHLLAVQAECYNPDKSDANTLVRDKIIADTLRDKSTRLGLVMEATDTVKDVLDSISIEAQGCARVWDGTSWSPSRVPTRNLAAWVLEILTSPIHEPSRYADTELDLESFGAWYEYCEDEGFCADGVITSAAKKSEILSTLLANGNAALLINQLTGLLEIAIDNGRDYPVALLTADNIISMSAVKEFKRLEDGMRVSYVNRDAEFAADTVLFMRDGGEYDPATDTLSQISLSYITDYLHAYKYVWRKQAEQIVRPLKATVQVGQYGSYYPVFSKILLQHRALAQGLGNATIRGLVFNQGILAEIQLYGSVDFPEGNPVCGVTINCTYGPGVLALKVTGSGRTSSLTVIDGISSSSAVMPRSGDTLAFGTLDGDGEFTLVATPMLITGSDPTEEGWQLTLVEYNEELYEYGQMPAYKSHVTLSADNSSELDISRMETENTAVNAAIEAASSSLSAIIDGTSEEVGRPDNVTGLTARAAETGIELSWNPIGTGLANSLKEYEIQKSTDSGATWQAAASAETNSTSIRFTSSQHYEASDFGSWRYRVRAVNLYGKESQQWSNEATVGTDGYGTWQTPSPSVSWSIDSRRLIIQLALSATQRQVYGSVKYKIRMKRDMFTWTDSSGQTQTVNADSTWYGPNLNGNPYGSEESYRGGTSESDYADALTSFVYILPLWGQGLDGAGKNLVDTPYIFDIQATNGVTSSPWLSASGGELHPTATVTALRDIVKANETAAKAYITELSAITANLGEISQGSMGGNNTNFWVLSDKITPAHTGDEAWKDKGGAFSVGGERQYIRVKPVLNPAGQITDYNIEITAGNISFTSTGTDFDGSTCIYSDSNRNLRMKLSHQGIEVQKNVGGDWVLIGKVTCDENNNMYITNTSDMPAMGTVIAAQNLIAYHFESGTDDNTGGNTLGCVFSGSAADADSPVQGGSRALKAPSGCSAVRIPLGSVQSGGRSRLVFLTKAEYVQVEKQLVHVSDQTKDTTVAVSVGKLNAAAKASSAWGLTTEQKNSNIFKMEVIS